MTIQYRGWWAQIAVAAWVVAAACPLCRGATGETDVFTTGTYAAQDAAPDYMTTTDPQGRTLKVTDGIALPVCPSDEGKVVIDWNSTSGPTAAFVLRTTGWGCAYTVFGTWVGGGAGPGGEPATWYSGFDAENSARIVLEVNEDGVDDDWVPLGGGGTLKVRVLGGPSANYTVRLEAGSGVCFNGEGGPSTIDVTVAGNGDEYQYTPVVLYGQSEGDTNIYASCPYTPVAAPADAMVAVVQEWEFRPNPPVGVFSVSPSIPQPQGQVVLTGIQVSPGEEVLFTVMFADADEKRPKNTQQAWQQIAGDGPYEVKMTCGQAAEWNARGSSQTETPPNISTREMAVGGKPVTVITAASVHLFIKASWDGTQPIFVTAVVKDNSPVSGRKDTDLTISWSFVKRTGLPPASLTLVDVSQWGGQGAVRVPVAKWTEWLSVPARYKYRGDPLRNPPGRPCYSGQSVLETFGDPTPQFQLADLTQSWRDRYGVQTAAQAASLLFKMANSTFVFAGADDEITDIHMCFQGGSVEAFNSSAYDDPQNADKSIGYTISQTYSCVDNQGQTVTLGRTTIESRYGKRNGGRMVKKTGP